MWLAALSPGEDGGTGALPRITIAQPAPPLCRLPLASERLPAERMEKEGSR
jgi:hypothetical protein